MRTLARHLLALVVLLAAYGCGSRQHDSAASTSGQASSPGVAPSLARSEALVSALPREIPELTSQVIIYECPKCDRMFETAGQCVFDQNQLYPVKITYICGFDGTIIDHLGQCPKCGRMVQIEKAKMLPSGIRVEREK